MNRRSAGLVSAACLASTIRLACAALVFSACGADPAVIDVPSAGGAAGAIGGLATAGASGATNAGASGGGSGGTNAIPDASATAGAGGSTGGPVGTDAAAATLDAGRSDASAKDGGAKEGCANNSYPLCIDFENGIDTKVWTGNANSVVTGNVAHGLHSYHAYPGGGFLKTTELGPIKDLMWGRFYLHMSPGAPGGHGEIVGAYDVSGDWYEMGWQFDGLLGNWHGLGGEKPLRSHPNIVDRWYCVEYLFDGAKAAMPEWWIDGQEVEYYMPVDAAKGPRVATQFKRIEVGFTSFAGLGLALEPYGNNNPPVMTDMWIDDIAFDTKRIGCIE
jgi:hypothetical protein